MAQELFLTVLVPVYNENKRLPATLEKVARYCSERLNESYEILVVDDGSTDATPALLNHMRGLLPELQSFRYAPNRGKGAAIKAGMEIARGRFVVFMDADSSTSIEELDKILPLLIDGNEVVVATRKHSGAMIEKHQPVWRESMGKVFTWLTNTVLDLQMSDFTCGFKGFEASAGKFLFAQQRVPRWAFDAEILFLAKRAGMRIVEVPVLWINSPESKVRIVRDTAESLASLFAIRWYAARGHYRTRPDASPGNDPQ